MPLHPRGCPAFPRWSRGARGLGVALPSGPGTLTGHPADAAGRPGPAGPARVPRTPCRISEPPAASHSAPLPGKARGAWTAAHAPPGVGATRSRFLQRRPSRLDPLRAAAPNTPAWHPLWVSPAFTRVLPVAVPPAPSPPADTHAPPVRLPRGSATAANLVAKLGWGGPGPEGRGRAVP